MEEEVPELRIRDFEESDYDYIVEAMDRFQVYLWKIDTLDILQEPPVGFGKEYTDEVMKKVKENDGNIFIASKNGTPIGFSIAVKEPQTHADFISCGKQTYGQIIELFVEEEHRGRGVGKALVETAEEYLKKLGCTKLHIQVYVPNKSTHEIYKKLGYRDEDIYVFKNLT